MNDWGILSPTGPFWHHNAMREGPDWLWKATEHVRGAMTTVDTTQLRVHMTALRDLHAENVPVIVIGAAYHVWGANRRLGNVPKENSAADVFRGWGRPVYHVQIFVRR